jgi:hypothetical protein
MVELYLHSSIKYRSVGIVTGYGLDSPDLIAGSARFFSSPRLPNKLVPTQPPIKWVSVFFPWG